jgi:hypothetical protein
MRLIDVETQEEIKVCSIVTMPSDPLAEPWTVVYMPKPHKPASSGKVTCEDKNGNRCEYYAGVWGLEWVEREDRL